MLYSTILIILSLFSQPAWSHDNPQQQQKTSLVPVVPELIQVQKSYNENESVEIIAKGRFLDHCYFAGPEEIKKEEQIFLIKIFAFHLEGTNCALALKEYQKNIQLGELPSGRYEIYFLDQADKDIYFDTIYVN